MEYQANKNKGFSSNIGKEIKIRKLNKQKNYETILEIRGFTQKTQYKLN
jgi:hypothetical protein